MSTDGRSDFSSRVLFVFPHVSGFVLIGIIVETFNWYVLN